MERLEIFYNTELPVGEDIKSGRPCSIIHFEPKSGEILHEEHHNMENVKIPDHAIEAFAQTLLPAAIAFFETEEGKKISEQLEKEAAEKKPPRKRKR